MLIIVIEARKTDFMHAHMAHRYLENQLFYGRNNEK